jgi:AcrR family transcriptional regulator
VLAAAVELADRDGLEALSMRRLGAELGVEAMSLYNHVANKDDLLDGIVDMVTAEFDDPRSAAGADWRAVVRRCAGREREVLLRHPWTASLAESRARTGPVRLRYYEALLSVLREAGFSQLGAYRANLTIDSFVYGFTLQEVAWEAWPPFDGAGFEAAASFVDRSGPDEYPNLAGIAQLAATGRIDIGADFVAGLEAILDSLERMRETP